MTIDEAIEKEKNMATKGNIIFPQRPDIAEKHNKEHEHIAEWLEELKAYRAFDKTNFSDGYNKAIDDYMNKLCDHCMQQTNECYKLECPFCTDGCDIVNIAERLKAGGVDV